MNEAVRLNEPVSFFGVLPPLTTPGFSVPIFGSEQRPYLQLEGQENVVIGFVPLPSAASSHVAREPASWERLRQQHENLSLGESLQFAFAFDDASMVVGDRDWLKPDLLSWLEVATESKSIRRKYPFTLLDVAEFVDCASDRIAVAVEDCRKFLANRGLRQTDRWAKRERGLHNIPDPPPRKKVAVLDGDPRIKRSAAWADRAASPLRPRKTASRMPERASPGAPPAPLGPPYAYVTGPGSRGSTRRYDSFFTGDTSLLMGADETVAVLSCPHFPRNCPAKLRATGASCGRCDMKITGGPVRLKGG